MIKLLIYDLDGTLVDTREDIARSANYMLSQMDLPQLEHAEIAGYVGRGVHYLISGCLKSEDPKKIEKAIKIYRRYYGEHMMDHSRLFPGAGEMLKFFEERHQVVLTNKPNPFSEDMLKALGVAGYFKKIIGGGDPGYPKKPDPAAVRSMMECFSASREETLFVGDSLVDIETAKNAGVRIGVVTHGFSTLKELQSAAPDAIAEDFPKLMEWIKKNDH